MNREPIYKKRRRNFATAIVASGAIAAAGTVAATSSGNHSPGKTKDIYTDEFMPESNQKLDASTVGIKVTEGETVLDLINYVDPELAGPFDTGDSTASDINQVPILHQVEGIVTKEAVKGGYQGPIPGEYINVPVVTPVPVIEEIGPNSGQITVIREHAPTTGGLPSGGQPGA